MRCNFYRTSNLKARRRQQPSTEHVRLRAQKTEIKGNVMDLQLPRPIETFVRAENSGDVDSMSDCFAPYATVRDDGHYYEGLPAIKNWTARTKEKYAQTVTPLEIRTSDGNATLKARLTGQFPGSPLTADFHFTLVNDQIASLQIRS